MKSNATKIILFWSMVVILFTAAVLFICIQTQLLSLKKPSIAMFDPIIDSEECNFCFLEQLDTSTAMAIHNKLKYVYGNPNMELPEQQLISEYISPNDIVLELGTNIGLSTMMIAYHLSDSANLVTSESDPDNWNKAMKNRDANNFKYYIVPAISDKKMIQSGWSTKIIKDHDRLPKGWEYIPTVSLDAIKKLSKLDHFNALVIDCEGCANAVLAENPEILQNAKVIIFEHDETTKQQYDNMINILSNNNFERVRCIRAPAGHGGKQRQIDCFHAVYKKRA